MTWEESFFNGQDSIQRATILASFQWRYFQIDDVIISQNDIDDRVYLLFSGHVRVMVYTEKGREVTFTELGPGDLFGEYSALDDLSRLTSVKAIDAVKVGVITKNDFIKLIHDRPEMALQLLKNMVTTIRMLTNRVMEHTTMTVKLRVFSELMRLVEVKSQFSNSGIITPSPTAAGLASLVGSQREVVSTELNILLRSGVISRGEGHLIINDITALRFLISSNDVPDGNAG